jgi:hypothetical protein
MDLEYCTMLIGGSWVNQSEYENAVYRKVVLDIRNWPFKNIPNRISLGSTRPHLFYRFIERL